MTGTFGYLRPTGLAEALAVLARGGPGVRVLSGGTDLMVAVRRGRERPACLLDVTAIPGLREIREEPDGTLRIGAAATHTEVADSPAVRRGAPVLARACAAVGSVAVRNLGTLGGNAANASIAADTLPALAALRAHFEVAGPLGPRRLSADEFFLGPGRTALGPAEVLTAILVPRQPPHGAAFLKVARRRAAAISRLSVAVMVNPGAGLARIALGAVFPRPQRLLAAEEALHRGFDDAHLDEAGRLAEEAVRQVSGDRPSMAYKLPVIRAAVARALRDAREFLGEVAP